MGLAGSVLFYLVSVPGLLELVSHTGVTSGVYTGLEMTLVWK